MADRNRLPILVSCVEVKPVTDKRAKVLATALVLAATLSAAGQGANKPSQPKQTRPRQSNQSDAALGQQVFSQNCSRCHKAPEGIPSSISGTVALHMRIRAGLSEKDYRHLLAFLSQ